VYYRHGGSQGVILFLYVDDMLFFGTSVDMINEVKTLCQSFDMKDLGEDDVILNIKLIKGWNGITLTQSHYVDKCFEPFWLQGHQTFFNTL
jgi:hypothetical protein